MPERDLSQIRELVDRIVGERGKLDKSKHAEEVSAMRELGARLGMSGFELADEQREGRIERAQADGEDPGMHLTSEEMQLQHRIEGLRKDQGGVREGRGDVVIIAQDEAGYDAQRQDEARKIEERVGEIQREIDHLDSMRQKFNRINAALKSGDVRPAREEIGLEIDTVEASVMQLDRSLSLARRGEIKGNMTSYEEQKRKLEEKRDRLRHMIENLYLYKK